MVSVVSAGRTPVCGPLFAVALGEDDQPSGQGARSWWGRGLMPVDGPMI